MKIRIMTWNINGIRAIAPKIVHGSKHFWDYIVSTDSDIVCFNETKIDADKMANLTDPDDYPYMYHSHADKKGYSGVSVYSKLKPLRKLIPPKTLDVEGRLVVLEFRSFILIALYQPNAGAGLKRLSYRKRWDNLFRKYVLSLEKHKGIIMMGDMNVSNEDIDIYKPETHGDVAGFTDVERSNFKQMLVECRLFDVWRSIHPRTVEYTYFDYRSRARKRGHGWRLDYAIVSDRLSKNVKSCSILGDVMGSDHVPVLMVYTLV